MKKYFFLALVAGLALCNVSCGSDDENEETTDVSKLGNTQTGKYDSKVAHYEITKNSVMAAPIGTDLTDGKTVTASIISADIIAQGQVLIGANVTVDGQESQKYATLEIVGVDGETYTLRGDKGKGGTMKIQREVPKSRETRAGNSVELVFDLTVYVQIGDMLVPIPFNTSGMAQETIDAAIDAYTSSITNTWQIERMKLVLDFDSKTDAATETAGGDLRPFIELCDNNSLNLSDQERKDLTRTIQSFIIEKPNLLVLKYAEGGSDAAAWRWVSKADNSLAIGITLKDKYNMGNKFLNDDSKIAVELRTGGKINLILTTRLEKDKCTASLIINLK